MPYILQTKKCLIYSSQKMSYILKNVPYTLQTPALHPQNTHYKSPELQSCVLYLCEKLGDVSWSFIIVSG